MLFGGEDEITGCEAAENVAENPDRHFEIDPRALFAALRAERAGGARIAGYWHSHPGGDARPSATDATMAPPDGRFWLIVAGDDATLWRAGDHGLYERFEPVAIET